MFQGYTSLTEGPTLPARTLVNYCYDTMFQGYSSLNSVTCMATEISATECTDRWLDGVAARGTFMKAAPMTGWTSGVNGVPTGWKVVIPQ